MEAPRENCGWGNRPRTAALVGSREHPSSTSQTRPPRRHSGQISRNRRGVLSLSRGATRWQEQSRQRPAPVSPGAKPLRDDLSLTAGDGQRSKRSTWEAARDVGPEPSASAAQTPRPAPGGEPIRRDSRSCHTKPHPQPVRRFRVRGDSPETTRPPDTPAPNREGRWVPPAQVPLACHPPRRHRRSVPREADRGAPQSCQSPSEPQTRAGDRVHSSATGPPTLPTAPSTGGVPGNPTARGPRHAHNHRTMRTPVQILP